MYVNATDFITAAQMPENYVGGVFTVGDVSYVAVPRVVEMLSLAIPKSKGLLVFAETPRGTFKVDVTDGVLTLPDP
jgi:hypothetical protein